MDNDTYNVIPCSRCGFPLRPIDRKQGARHVDCGANDPKFDLLDPDTEEGEQEHE